MGISHYMGMPLSWANALDTRDRWLSGRRCTTPNCRDYPCVRSRGNWA